MNVELAFASGGLRAGDVSVYWLPWLALLCAPSVLFYVPPSQGPLQRVVGLALALMRTPGTTEEWPVMLAVLALAFAPTLRRQPPPAMARALALALGAACVVASSSGTRQGGVFRALLSLDLAAAYVSGWREAGASALPLVAVALGARGGVRGAEWGVVPVLGLSAAAWLRPARARLWVAVAAAALAVCARSDPKLEAALLLVHAVARWTGVVLAHRGLFKQPRALRAQGHAPTRPSPYPAAAAAGIHSPA